VASRLHHPRQEVARTPRSAPGVVNSESAGVRRISRMKRSPAILSVGLAISILVMVFKSEPIPTRPVRSSPPRELSFDSVALPIPPGAIPLRDSYLEETPPTSSAIEAASPPYDVATLTGIAIDAKRPASERSAALDELDSVYPDTEIPWLPFLASLEQEDPSVVASARRMLERRKGVKR